METEVPKDLIHDWFGQQYPHYSNLEINITFEQNKDSVPIGNVRISITIDLP